MSKQLRELMHEKLDGVLSEEMTEELFRNLARDEDAALEYARLETVDNLLSTAPHARAPQRLAVTIMARLAQSIEVQAKLQAVPAEVRQAIMQSLSLSMVAMMPLMVGASWIVLNAMGDPAILMRVLDRVITVTALMVDAQLVLLEEIEPYLKGNPALAAACMQLLPSMMIGLLDYMEGK